MLSLGICNFTKQQVNMQDTQQEMKFTSRLKNCGQAKSTAHHTIRHRLWFRITLLIFHGVCEKSVKDSILKPTEVEQTPAKGLGETLMMDFKTEYLRRIS